MFIIRRKLKKYICPECNYVNPLMELINTAVCTNCNNSFVKIVENSYIIINTDTLQIIEISEEK